MKYAFTQISAEGLYITASAIHFFFTFLKQPDVEYSKNIIHFNWL